MLLKKITSLEVAKKTGTHDATVCQWLKKYRKNPEDFMPVSGNLRKCDKEIKDLEQENAFLKNNGVFCEKSRIKYACIKVNNSGLPIFKCCKLVRVSKSGSYDWLKIKSSSKVDKLGLKVVEIFYKFKRRHRAIRMRNELKKENIKGSPKRIRKAMEKYSLVEKEIKKFVVTTNSKHNLPVLPSLLMRAFNMITPNTVWVADFIEVVNIVQLLA